MAKRKEILSRAKELIESMPSAGKERINTLLRKEYGRGLRNSVILGIKAEVSIQIPSLYPKLYQSGSVSKGYREIYNGWRAAGFLPFEARELTLGHGKRYQQFDSKRVFNSEPSIAARETREKLIKLYIKQGFTPKQIRAIVYKYYTDSKKVDPWEHIRAEYKPRDKVKRTDYMNKVRKRSKSKQKRLNRTSEELIIEMRKSLAKTTDPRIKRDLIWQIRNLGGTP